MSPGAPAFVLVGEKDGAVIHGVNYGAVQALSDAELDQVIAALEAAKVEVEAMKEPPP